MNDRVAAFLPSGSDAPGESLDALLRDEGRLDAREPGGAAPGAAAG